MATTKANRLLVGSGAWMAEERASAFQIAQAETEEFTYSARNEVEWLNEHMAEIFSENQVNVAEIFKTPGKLRGKTPRTIRKNNALGERAPLSDVFSATPRGGPSPFKKIHFEKPAPSFRVAEDLPTPADEAGPSVPAIQATIPPKPIHNAFDSGYYGSQLDDTTQRNTQPFERIQEQSFLVTSPAKSVDLEGSFEVQDDEDDENLVILGRDSDVQRSPSDSFQSAEEEQTRKAADIPLKGTVEPASDKENEPEQPSYPVLESPLQSRHETYPQKYSPQRSSPSKSSLTKVSPLKDHEMPNLQPAPDPDDEVMEDAQSPSEGSSPLRPIVRKSSLNFASLPAREPLTNKKSIGNRVSRTSQLEQSRTSYYGRQTGGNSLGTRQEDEDDDDDMDVNHHDGAEQIRDDTDSKIMRLHNKTSTQRLQDQISMLGQTQNLRPSKSIPSTAAVHPQNSQPSQPPAPRETRQKSPQRSPERKSKLPGAFPGDDEDDSWIGAPPAVATMPSIFSPRPAHTKSHTTDAMEGIHGQENIGGSEFNIAKRGDQQRNMSPVREPLVPDRTASTLGHIKSVSTSVLRSPRKPEDSLDHRKPIAVSNPNPSVHSNDEESSTTPPKSPSRSFRGSPLKAAKDKFSSILKTSRGLFASSAAISAEAKSSAISPVSAKMASKDGPSFEDAVTGSAESVHYPELSKIQSKSSQLSLRMPESPFKHTPRKTRASTEREEKRKEDEAREAKAAKEAREAQKMEGKLEKERMKVSEQARVYHLEQERVAAMHREFEARKEQKAKASQGVIPRVTRTSPRKTKAQLEAEGVAAAAASTDELAERDTDMTDASMAPPPRPKSQIGRPAAKRPLKPAKDSAKAKPPTVIRVDTGSQRGHQYHPSNSTLAASLQDSLSTSSSQPAAPAQSLRHKVSTSSLQSKASSNGFKSAATKALEAAARKKEQDELAAARKREAKLEVERQRAAIKEEERRKEEQQRRQEAERQREIQRERERVASNADAKKAASRQAIEKRRLEMEKAKETRPPPPAVRPQQPSGEHHDKALPPLPQQRMDAGPSKPPQMNQSVQRTQQEIGRSVLNGAKAPPKRPLQQDTDEHHSRPNLQRNGPSYQQNEQQSKRRKTEDRFDDDEDMTDRQPKMTAPPIRQSSIRQKDAPTKSLFPSGYANVPPPNNLQRSTLISQHNMNQSKPAHPMDMATVSKAPIPFASSSSQVNSQHKTPARPGVQNTGKSVGKSGAKSAAKSSPRYQNGENIELPEIHTDSEDEDSDNENFQAQPWTNSPDLRRALFEQEKKDPTEVFGNPGPLNMEEVFSKSKDRFHKFRARTSSANWTGQDRLTEDEIKKDLEARDKVRRQGGWTYDTMV